MHWDCLTLAAAGKGLSFPPGLHSPPICLAEIQALTAHPQARPQQAAEPGQGLPAAKREWCCIHFFWHIISCSCPYGPASSPASALPLLRSFQGQLSLQNGISLQCYGTGNMPVWLQRVVIISLFILCQWALAGCSATYTRDNRTERRGPQGASLQLMEAMGFWLASVKPSIPVPYVIVQNRML